MLTCKGQGSCLCRLWVPSQRVSRQLTEQPDQNGTKGNRLRGFEKMGQQSVHPFLDHFRPFRPLFWGYSCPHPAKLNTLKRLPLNQPDTPEWLALLFAKKLETKNKPWPQPPPSQSWTQKPTPGPPPNPPSKSALI